MACVYIHRRADDGQIFYIGKGSRDDRATYFKKRNPYWQSVAAKHGVLVEIVARFDTDALACECEQELIAWYGRGNLANLTDGGEGSVAVVMSEETKSKLSRAASQPRSEAWIASMRAARAGGGNGGVVKAGDKLPESWVKNLSAAKVGDKNPMYGKSGLDHHGARLVLHAGYGYVFASVQDAADFFGMKMKKLHNQLSGHRPNKFNLEFA
jgi:hypothetical protein